MDQALRRLGPRIKLLKRHLLEWSDLLAYQKEARRLFQEKANTLSLPHHKDRLARIEQINTRGIILAQVAARQLDERQKMRARYQQEEADLELTIGRNYQSKPEIN